MNTEEFLNEIKEYSLDDLRLIYEGQKDLYSQEELKIIYDKITHLEEEENKAKETWIKEHLPKEINCPKCDGPNSSENDCCSFCGYKFDKNQFLILDENENCKCDNKEDEEDESYTFQYIISFLIPLIGFIIGAIFLTKDNKEEKEVGKGCILVAIVSVIISAFFIPSLFF